MRVPINPSATRLLAVRSDPLGDGNERRSQRSDGMTVEAAPARRTWARWMPRRRPGYELRPASAR
jgi:hypothetical protein